MSHKVSDDVKSKFIALLEHKYNYNNQPHNMYDNQMAIVNVMKELQQNIDNYIDENPELKSADIIKEILKNHPNLLQHFAELIASYN